MTTSTVVLRQPTRIGDEAKNHNAPVARLEDNKLATDFGMSILHKRLGEIAGIVATYGQKELPATTAWEQIVDVINRG